MHARVRDEEGKNARGRKTESRPRGEREEASVCPRVRGLRSVGLVCVPCSECTEQALLVRGHLSYDRSVPTLPARLPASCLPACLPCLPYLLARLTALFFLTLLLSQRPSLPLAEPVGFSSFKVGTHLTHSTRVLAAAMFADNAEYE